MNKQIEYLIDCANNYERSLGKGIGMSRDEVLVRMVVNTCEKICLDQRDPSNLNYKPSEKFAEAITQYFGIE